MASGTDEPPAAIDDADRLLLQALWEDGRASHRGLAERTGLSLGTVNRRLRRLQRDGVWRSTVPRLDAEAVGWSLTVLVGLRIDKGHLREVQEQIARDPRVFSVYDVTGEWDGFVLARVQDRADLDDLAKTALSMPHIQRTNTMVVLSTVLDGALVPVPPGRHGERR